MTNAKSCRQLILWLSSNCSYNAYLVYIEGRSNQTMVGHLAAISNKMLKISVRQNLKFTI